MNLMFLFYCLYGTFLGGYLSLWQPSILARGFSVANLATLIALKTFIDIAASVPTGILADKIGRKKTVILGLFAFSSAFAIPVFMVSPWAIALAAIGFSIGDNCIDGALDTWASQLAKPVRNLKHDVRHFISRDQLQRLGIIIGALGVSFAINKYGLGGSIQWKLYTFLALLLVLVAASIKEGDDSPVTEAVKKFSFSEAIKSAPLAIMVGTFFFGMSDGSIDVGLIARFQQLGLSTALGFGVLQASMSAGRILGGQIWKRAKIVERSWVPAAAVLGSTILFFIFSFLELSALVGLLVWVVRIVVLSAYFSTLRALILNSTPNARFHATALSFNTTAYLVGKLLFTGIFAGLLGVLSVSTMLTVGAVASAISGLLYLRRLGTSS